MNVYSYNCCLLINVFVSQLKLTYFFKLQRYSKKMIISLSRQSNFGKYGYEVGLIDENVQVTSRTRVYRN